MSSSLMETVPGGESDQYSSQKTFTARPTSPVKGQFSSSSTGEDSGTHAKEVASSKSFPTSGTDLSRAGPEGAASLAEQGERKAENMRYGQAMSEQGYGGMTTVGGLGGSSSSGDGDGIDGTTSSNTVTSSAPQAASATASAAKITVLISGNGSNLQALIDAASTPALPNAKIIRVISNRKSAFGLQRAEKASIPTHYHNLVPYKKRHLSNEQQQQDQHQSSGDDDERGRVLLATARAEYDRDLASLVLADKPDLVVCAGWMHILAPTFLAPLRDSGVPVINLHPALPGAFNGTQAIERAWEAFGKGQVAGTGVMVHRVIDEVDMGEPLVVRHVEIKQSEAVDALKERIHSVEWEVIVEGTRLAIEALRRQRASHHS